MSRQILLLAFLFATACAADVDDAPPEASIDGGVELASVEQASCNLGPQPYAVHASLDSVGGWTGSFSNQYIYSHFDPYQQAWNYGSSSPARLLSGSRYAGPCVSISATQYRCGPGSGITVTCPSAPSALVQVSNLYSYQSASNQPAEFGEMQSPCGPKWKLFRPMNPQSFHSKSLSPVGDGTNRVICHYNPWWVELKPL